MFLAAKGPEIVTAHPLRILVIGAHPDDCELKAGGVAAMYRQAGHVVKFVSVTNGQSGHHRLQPDEVIRVRKAETEAVSRLTGIEYEILNHRDGFLLPTLEARQQLIALIRRFQPSLILTHRPNDYHPDHRATATLVCDAAYMVTVPLVVPEVPHLRDNPVIAYLSDDFTRPQPFAPSVAIDIEPVLDQAIEQMACHQSQFFEWLAYNLQFEAQLPPDLSGRKRWLREWYCARIAPLADKYRSLLVQTYGPERGARIRYVEAFEGCEYGSPLTEHNRRELFPMLP